MPQTRTSTRTQTARSKKRAQNKNNCNAACQRQRCDKLMRACIEMVYVDKEADRVEKEYSRLEKNLTSAILRRESPSKVTGILAKLQPVIKKLNVLQKHHEELKRSCMFGNPKGNLCKAPASNVTNKKKVNKKVNKKKNEVPRKPRKYISGLPPPKGLYNSWTNKQRANWNKQKIQPREVMKKKNANAKGPPKKMTAKDVAVRRPPREWGKISQSLGPVIPQPPQKLYNTWTKNKRTNWNKQYGQSKKMTNNKNNELALSRLKTDLSNNERAWLKTEIATEAAKLKKHPNGKSVTTQANLQKVVKNLPGLNNLPKTPMNNALSRLKTDLSNNERAWLKTEIAAEAAKLKKHPNGKSGKSVTTQTNLRKFLKNLPSLNRALKQQKYSEEQKRIQNHLNRMRK